MPSPRLSRRAVLGVLAGGAAAVSGIAALSPTQRLAFGRAVHARLRGYSALRTLDAHQHETVTQIAELILPETETPGATSVQVPAFIDLILTESMLEADRDTLLTGLAAIDAASHSAHGGDFVALAPTQQTALLRTFDTTTTRTPGSAAHAFATLKRLTLFGYFTSERVMTTVLHYEVIPSQHAACVTV
jgi:hypothetical protein